jgi:FixJ family two-component response regulator
MTIRDAGTVFIVDDDAGVRASIQGLAKCVGLRSEPFAGAQDFLSRSRYDGGTCCLVLDVRLPGLSGLDFQRQLVEAGIQIPIIFITAHADIRMSVRAMKFGAVEFLTKPFSDQDLLDAIEQALERDHIRRKQQSDLIELEQRYRKLTPKECEVMKFVVAGLLNKQIASEICTTERTVKTHRGRVMRKMRAASLADLVRMAERIKRDPKLRF